MSSTAPLASQHLQRSDVQGALLLAAVAWISVDLHRVRLHGFRIRSGVAIPPWLLHSALVITIALVKLYALSRVPLSLAAVVFNATSMIKLAIRSSREHTGDWPWNVASTVLLLCGTAMLAAASTTDQRVTAAMIRDRFSRATVLQHLLLCSTLMVAIMAWIHETFYAFASGSVSWPRQLSRLVFEKLRKHDHPSAIRAYAFAVLSGLAAGCAVLSEKERLCLAEILRTSDGLVSTPTLSLLALLVTAWLVLALLESYRWHHAVIIDASQRELLLRHYLLVWMTVATVEGVVFFDEIDRRRLATASLGLVAVYVSSANFDLRPPIEPKYDDNEAVDPSPHLLDATKSLLDADEPLASAPTATDPSMDLEPPPAYRPPAHFRVVQRDQLASTMNATEHAPATASATAVVTQEPSATEAPVYRIQLQPRAHVTFDESVVDNEHLGRKKSNKCCIFHKKRAFGESSSESGDDSDKDRKTPHAKDCTQRHRKPASQRPSKPQPFVPAEQHE